MPAKQSTPTAATTTARGQSYSKVAPVRQNLDTAVILSKMIPDRISGKENQSMSPGVNGGDLDLGGLGYLQEISDQVATSKEDSLALLQLLPEIELSMQIMISLVLSPRDFINTEMTYKFPPNLLPPEMVTALIEVVETDFDSSYNIKAKLPEILRKAMFEDGSYPLVVIPENSLDDIINGRQVVAMESFVRSQTAKSIDGHTGLLGSSHAPVRQTTGNVMSLESLLGAELSTNRPPYNPEIKFPGNKTGKFAVPQVFDNANLLKLPRVLDQLRQNRVRTAMESMGGRAERLYHDPNHTHAAVQVVAAAHEASRAPYGHPLLMALPPESVIPAITPSEPSNPAGYFVILDQYGHPLSSAAQADYYRDLATNLNAQGQGLSSMLGVAAAELTGMDQFGINQVNVKQAQDAFTRVVERDLQTKLLNGARGLTVTLSQKHEAFKIMFARACANQQTRVLYLPRELMTYWAYDYNDNGTGRGFLENNKIMGSARALMLFANLNSQIRNSVDHRTLDITVDEADPNPAKTRDMIVGEFLRNKANSLPWATSNPKGMMNYMQLSGTNVNMSGATGYPGTKLDIIDRDIAPREINLDFDENLKKRQIMGIGIAPELTDLTTNIEFSSKMATSNALTTKRAILLQDQTIVHAEDVTRKFCVNSPVIIDKMLKIVGQFAKDLNDEQRQQGERGIVKLFIDNLQVHLPRPDIGTLQQQSEDFDAQASALDKILESLFPEAMFAEEVAGPHASAMRMAIIASTKAQALREWCRTNNYMTDVLDVFDIDETDSVGSLALAAQVEHVGKAQHILKAVGLKLVALKIVSENQWNTMVERMEKEMVKPAEDDLGGAGSSLSDSSGGGYGDDTGDGGDGGDDFGGDLFPPDDTGEGDDTGDGTGDTGETDTGDAGDDAGGETDTGDAEETPPA